jgi:hypothetical protein
MPLIDSAAEETCAPAAAVADGVSSELSLLSSPPQLARNAPVTGSTVAYIRPFTSFIL